MVRGGHKCCVNGCENTKRENRDVVFFKLPREPERRRVWFTNMGRQDLLDVNVEKKDWLKVCSDHFEVNQFSCSDMSRLAYQAVPTILAKPKTTRTKQERFLPLKIDFSRRKRERKRNDKATPPSTRENDLAGPKISLREDDEQLRTAMGNLDNNDRVLPMHMPFEEGEVRTLIVEYIHLYETLRYLRRLARINVYSLYFSLDGTKYPEATKELDKIRKLTRTLLMGNGREVYRLKVVHSEEEVETERSTAGMCKQRKNSGRDHDNDDGGDARKKLGNACSSNNDNWIEYKEDQAATAGQLLEERIKMAFLVKQEKDAAPEPGEFIHPISHSDWGLEFSDAKGSESANDGSTSKNNLCANSKAVVGEHEKRVGSSDVTKDELFDISCISQNNMVTDSREDSSEVGKEAVVGVASISQDKIYSETEESEPEKRVSSSRIGQETLLNLNGDKALDEIVERHLEMPESFDNNSNSWVCKFCPFQDESKDLLARHLLKHLNFKPGDSPLDLTGYKKLTETVEQHLEMLESHRDEMALWICKFCPFEYNSKDLLFHHMLKHFNPKNCQGSSDVGNDSPIGVSGNNEMMERHLQSLENRIESLDKLVKRHISSSECYDKELDLWMCKFCPSQFKSKDVLAPHLFKHLYSSNKKMIPICEHCGIAFVLQASYEDHVGYSEQYGSSGHACRQCGVQMSAQCTLDRHHKLMHSLHHMSHASSVGGITVENKDTLQNHLQHDDGKNDMKNCKVYSEKLSLTKYPSKCPVKAKPHKCNFCGRVFAHKAWLAWHVERHRSGAKLYKCFVCRRRFAQMSSRDIHQRLHTGAYPHCCSYCNKGFLTPGARRIHERIHTGERLSCLVCNRSYICERSATAHRKQQGLDHEFRLVAAVEKT